MFITPELTSMLKPLKKIFSKFSFGPVNLFVITIMEYKKKTTTAIQTNASISTDQKDLSNEHIQCQSCCCFFLFLCNSHCNM